MNVVELFSGIGSQKEALKRSKLRKKAKIIYTSDWFVPSIISYDLLHNGDQKLKRIKTYSKEKLIQLIKNYNLSYNGKTPITDKGYKSMSLIVLQKLYAAIRRTKNVGNIENVDANKFYKSIGLLTYSFPCQDLSNVGAFHGYVNGIDKNMKTRSGLLWEVARILKSIRESGSELPKFLLMENVAALNAGKHKKNFEIWKKELRDLGYYNQVYLLNARNFGIPQNRERLFMISVKIFGNDRLETLLDEYFKNNNLEECEMNLLPLKEILKTDYSTDYYLSEALQAQPNNTDSRKMIYENNHKLLDRNGNYRAYTSTLTTKQDRHPNSGVIDFKTDRNNYRFITPRESLMLMGFKEKQFDKLNSLNFPSRGNKLFLTRDKYYKITGNSIVVNVLKAIFDQINDIDEMFDNNY